MKASLSLELEELRKMKKESDLTPLVDRIRQQETNILERKLIRFAICARIDDSLIFLNAGLNSLV